MKIHLLVITLFFSVTAFAQLDTTHYFDGDYSLSLSQDSCASKSKPASYPFNGIVALGNPLFLCDRIYFKKGVKFDQKNHLILASSTFNLIPQVWFVCMSIITINLIPT